MIGTVLLVLVISTGGIQLYHWCIAFNKISYAKNLPPKKRGALLSVIICAHNEGLHLRANLPSVLEQDYQPLEVLVLDHGSTDDTRSVLADLGSKYSNLFHHHVPYIHPGKRDPLHTGIEKAKGEWILLTDADCRPTGPSWVSHMYAALDLGYDVVYGVGPFYREPSVVNAFARWENLLTFLQSGSRVIQQRPYMGIGRNLGYRKSLYVHTDIDLPGGDDDLLINQIAPSSKGWLVLAPQAAMLSPSPDSWKDFLRSKRRHVSTSIYYRWPDQLQLLVFAASCWIYLVGSLGLLVEGMVMVGLILLLVRYLMIGYRLKRLPNYSDSYLFGPLLPLVDLSLIIYYPILAVFMLWKPPTKW